MRILVNPMAIAKANTHVLRIAACWYHNGAVRPGPVDVFDLSVVGLSLAM